MESDTAAVATHEFPCREGRVPRWQADDSDGGSIRARGLGVGRRQISVNFFLILIAVRYGVKRERVST